jgi:FdrA protein
VGADFSAWQERYAGRVAFARTLTEAASQASALSVAGEDALALAAILTASSPREASVAERGTGLAFARHQPPPYLAALFSGGTLCDEALHIWGEQPGPVYSNIALNPAWRWHERETPPPGHYALDLGADEYTRGRPHPMIDPEARLKYLRAAASDPQVGVILLDIVLGYCAHPHPSSIYAPFIQESLHVARQAGRRLHYVISLCGTLDDPQRLNFQEMRLREAGAETYLSNAEAALRCLALVQENADRS